MNVPGRFSHINHSGSANNSAFQTSKFYASRRKVVEDGSADEADDEVDNREEVIDEEEVAEEDPSAYI